MSEEYFLTERGVKTLQQERNVFYQTLGIKELFYKENEVLLRNIGDKTSIALDVGCGLGTHLVLLSKHCKEVIGIDHSEAVLKHCRKQVADIPNVKVFKMNAKQLEFPDNCFDQSSCMFNTFGNMVNEEAALREIKRVTKPGGKIVFSLYRLNSIPERLEFYKKTGLKNAYVDGQAIKCENKFFSNTYTEENIRELCGKVGLELTIHPTRIAFVCEVVKK